MLGERSCNLAAQWRLGLLTLESILVASEAEQHASLRFGGFAFAKI